jgi:hypothetical protein
MGVPLSLTAVLVDQLAFGRYTRWTDSSPHCDGCAAC